MSLFGKKWDKWWSSPGNQRDVLIGTMGAGGYVIAEYRDNERRKREALRTGNREAYQAAVNAQKKIEAQIDEQELADIKAEEEALEMWDQYVEYGKQGALDMAAFRANPTEYIKKRTNYEGVQKLMTEGMDKSAAARGDLLGNEQQARIARGTADLITLKQQEALSNIMTLLDLGKQGTAAQTAISRDFDLARRGRDKDRMSLEEWMAQQTQLFHNTNRNIQAQRYSDANALTMNLINNAANLGMAGATLATGMSPRGVTPVNTAPVTNAAPMTSPAAPMTSPAQPGPTGSYAGSGQYWS
jgi:hypothetical protein